MKNNIQNKIVKMVERIVTEAKTLNKVVRKTNLLVNSEKSFVHQEVIKNIRETIDANNKFTKELISEIEILKRDLPLILKDENIAKKYIYEAGKRGIERDTLLKVLAGFKQILLIKEMALESLEKEIDALNDNLEKKYSSLIKVVEKEKNKFKTNTLKYKEEGIETVFDLASSIVEDKKSYTILPTTQNKDKKEILNFIKNSLETFTEKIQIFTMDENAVKELNGFRKKTNIEGGVTTLIKEELCISMKYQKGKLKIVLMSVVDKKLIELGYQTPITTLKKYKQLMEAN